MAAPNVQNGEDLTRVIDTTIPNYDDPNSTASQGRNIVDALWGMGPSQMSEEEWCDFVRITNEAHEARLPHQTRDQALSTANLDAVLKATLVRLTKEGFDETGVLAPGIARPARNNWATERRARVVKPACPTGYDQDEYKKAWKGVEEKYAYWKKHEHASAKRYSQGLASGDVYNDVVKTLKKRAFERAGNAAPGGSDGN